MLFKRGISLPLAGSDVTPGSKTRSKIPLRIAVQPKFQTGWHRTKASAARSRSTYPRTGPQSMAVPSACAVSRYRRDGARCSLGPVATWGGWHRSKRRRREASAMYREPRGHHCGSRHGHGRCRAHRGLRDRPCVDAGLRSRATCLAWRGGSNRCLAHCQPVGVRPAGVPGPKSRASAPQHDSGAAAGQRGPTRTGGQAASSYSGWVLAPVI